MAGKGLMRGRQNDRHVPGPLGWPGGKWLPVSFLSHHPLPALPPRWPSLYFYSGQQEYWMWRCFPGRAGPSLWQWPPLWGVLRHPQAPGCFCFSLVLPEGETDPVFLVPNYHLAHFGWCPGTQISDPRLQPSIQTRAPGKCSAWPVNTGSGHQTFCPIQVSSPWLAGRGSRCLAKVQKSISNAAGHLWLCICFKRRW